MADKHPLYAAALPKTDETETSVTFCGKPEGAFWGEPDNRPIEPAVFLFDRGYWERLGKPDKIVVGFSTEEGWDAVMHLSQSFTEHVPEGVVLEATDDTL